MTFLFSHQIERALSSFVQYCALVIVSLVVLHQARQLFCVRLLFFTWLVLMVKTDESDSESPNAQHAKLRMVDWPLKMFGENDCNRVSAKYRLPDGKYSSLDLSVTAAVVVTREKFAACCVGLTTQTVHWRFFESDGCHFPKWRSIFAIATGYAKVMRAQENKTIQHLKDMGLPCSNTLQRGGSGIPQKSGYVTMYVAGDSFEGSCECEFCAQFAKSLKADSSDEDGMCESKKDYGPGWLVQAPVEEEASGTQKTTSEGKRLNDNNNDGDDDASHPNKKPRLK